MTTLNASQIQELHTLYLEGCSAKAISNKFGCSINAVYYAMRRHKIVRRNRQEAAAAAFKAKPLSFQLPNISTKELESLKLLGTTLYWAEGYKTKKSKGIDFANSDPVMAVVFLKFLRQVCCIDEKRLHILLYSHDELQTVAQIAYWSKTLQVPKTQFSKPYIAKKRAGVEKKDKMPYGLVHLRYADKKLLWQVLDWIEELKNKYCVGGGVV